VTARPQPRRTRPVRLCGGPADGRTTLIPTDLRHWPPLIGWNAQAGPVCGQGLSAVGVDGCDAVYELCRLPGDGTGNAWWIYLHRGTEPTSSQAQASAFGPDPQPARSSVDDYDEMVEARTREGVGVCLQRLREDRGWSPKVAAERSGFTVAQIKEMESGCPALQLQALQAYARHLGGRLAIGVVNGVGETIRPRPGPTYPPGDPRRGQAPT
jgi:hypothetical protein